MSKYIFYFHFVWEVAQVTDLPIPNVKTMLASSSIVRQIVSSLPSLDMERKR